MPESGVNIGQEVIAKLDGIPVDLLQAVSERPGFKIARAPGVRPAKGGESTGLQPSRVEFRAGNGPDPADIRAGKLEAGKPHIIQHRHAETQVVPGAPVVAAPFGRIALSAGIGGAGDDQGPFIRSHAQHAVAGGDGLKHPIHVMDPGMGTGPVVVRMHDVQVDGLGQALVDEDRRLVHIRQIA